MALKLKNQIVSAFKMHGLTLRSDATKYLVEVLQPINEVEQSDCLDRLIEHIQKQPLTSSMVDKKECETAVHECNNEQAEEGDNIFTVIDAFDVPRYTYSAERKKFILDEDLGLPSPCLHGNAETKADLYRERYTILHQRTSRHELFTPPAIGVATAEESKKFKLRPVEYLLGSTTRLGEIIVLGMLTQLKEGKWYLEDPSGAVQLDLSKANFHTGLFTENCFVLAEGWYEDEVFHVNAFGFPPPEPASTTRVYFGNLNFFGGASKINTATSKRLKQLELANEDAMFVFLSDVWLDQVKVMDKLRILFTGYAEMPPTCFVFCGNFSSQPYGNKCVKMLKEAFHALADMLSELPSLTQHCKFVFVPGPQDPGVAHVLPRPALPNCITAEFRERVPGAVFTSNPCRIQYCTQQIVVLRENIVTKMCRNCVRFPTDGDIPAHFTKTLVCQGHLCPLPLHVEPVYWAHDNALRLYPLPDLIVCADKYDPFTSTQVNCTVINPGSLPKSDFSFKVYFPSRKQVEDSQIVDD